MNMRILLTVATILTAGASVVAAEEPELKAILESYVNDYRDDPSLIGSMAFGIHISGDGGGDWCVTVGGKPKGTKRADVTLTSGVPETPTFFYTMDAKTLRKIHAGQMNALTGMVKAFSTDASPLDVDVMEGFQPDEQFLSQMLSISFHFWTRGFPERVPFGDGFTRETHGANAAVFYYQPGLRSAWIQIAQGQHANADPRSQSNPFPSMIIGLKGQCTAKINGTPSVLSAGEMMFIPPGVKHEFINTHEEAFEGILLMFGDGA